MSSSFFNRCFYQLLIIALFAFILYLSINCICYFFYFYFYCNCSCYIFRNWPNYIRTRVNKYSFISRQTHRRSPTSYVTSTTSSSTNREQSQSVSRGEDTKASNKNQEATHESGNGIAFWNERYERRGEGASQDLATTVWPRCKSARRNEADPRGWFLVGSFSGALAPVDLPH